MAALQLLPTNPLHLGVAFRDLDDCVICQESLPEAIFSCGHTVYCLECFDLASKRSRNKRLKCPVCRTECDLEKITNRRQLQIGESSLSELDKDGALPFRPLLDFGEIPEDFETDRVAFKGFVDKIKKFMQDIGDGKTCRTLLDPPRAASSLNCIFSLSLLHAGKLDSEILIPAMRQQLTGYQQELVWAEVSKDADLHRVILMVDQKILQQHDMSAHFRSILKHVIEKDDRKALVGRALIGTTAVVADLALEGLGAGLQHFGSADVISSAAVFLLFSAVEIGRCLEDSTYTLEALSINIGEHACGCTAGALGAWAGFAGATALLGTGPLGVLIGVLSMFGVSFVSDLTVRTKYRKAANDWTKVKMELEKLGFAQRAAASIHIDLQTHSFAAAKEIYRKELLRVHPDRAVNDEAKKANGERTIELIACWQIVRAHYKDVIKDSGLCSTEKGAEVRDAKEPECVVEVFKIKVQKQGQETWTTVRTWFGPRENAQVGTKAVKTKNDETVIECIEKGVIYF